MDEMNSSSQQVKLRESERDTRLAEADLSCMQAACADEARAKDALVSLNSSLRVLVLVKEEAEVLLSMASRQDLHIRTRDPG